jgi:hypothetical protein
LNFFVKYLAVRAGGRTAWNRLGRKSSEPPKLTGSTFGIRLVFFLS